jgi:serine/threonine protein kinase
VHQESPKAGSPVLEQPSQAVASRYKVSKYLGAGASGTVYKGMDTKSGKRVAIKVISVSGMDKQDRRKLFKELDMLRQVSKTCSRHHVACLLDHFTTKSQTGESLVIVMQYIPGKTLGELYFEHKNAPPPSKAAVQSMATQLFEALAFIHSVDVCHHDLSEANVMWGRWQSQRIRTPLCGGRSKNGPFGRESNKLTLIDFGWAGRLHKKTSGRKKYCDDVNAAAKLMRDLAAQNHPDLHDYMQRVYGDSQSFSAQQVAQHVKTLGSETKPS